MSANVLNDLEEKLNEVLEWAQGAEDEELPETAAEAVKLFKQVRAELTWPTDEDRPLPEDEEIQAAHPMRTSRHDLYLEAMRLVSARHSKGALVGLVNWLLARIDRAERGVSGG